MSTPVETPVRLIASVEHSETSFEEIDELVSPINQWVDLRRKFLEVARAVSTIFLFTASFSESEEKCKIGPNSTFSPYSRFGTIS